jgi:hypothetical protein
MTKYIDTPSIYGHDPHPVALTMQEGGVLFVDYYREWAWFRIGPDGMVGTRSAGDRDWATARFGPEWSAVLSAAIR